MKHLVIGAMMFAIGAIVGSMVAFFSVAGALGERAMLYMNSWLSLPQFWWAWSLGGGVVAVLAYLAVQVSRGTIQLKLPDSGTPRGRS